MYVVELLSHSVNHTSHEHTSNSSIRAGRSPSRSRPASQVGRGVDEFQTERAEQSGSTLVMEFTSEEEGGSFNGGVLPPSLALHRYRKECTDQGWSIVTYAFRMST